jgi:hypothetical protein
MLLLDLVLISANQAATETWASSVELLQLVEAIAKIAAITSVTGWRKVPCRTMVMAARPATKCVAALQQWSEG